MSAADVVANGTSTPHVPEPETTQPPAKRKRASTEEDAPHTNGTSELLKESSPTVTKDVSFRDLLADISTVLSNYDTLPSILTFKLSTDVNRSSASGEPTAKRTKLTSDAPATIADKLKEGHYTTLDALVKDVDSVATAYLTPIKTKEVNPYPSPYGTRSSLSSQEMRLWNSVLAFQKVLNDIVRAEEQRESSIKSAKNDAAKSAEGEVSTPEEVTVKTEVIDGDMLQNGKTVLTVYANAPGPKQLFSSFQQPISVRSKLASRELDASVEIVTPLRETGLPNFIGTTKIPSMPLDDDFKSKKASTIGTLFAPPATLPKLQPPKPSKKLTTTGNTITFVPLDQPFKPGRRNSYNWCSARLSVGQWLGYGGVDSPQEPTSPQAKRKQRDRTLSTGEAFLAPSAVEKDAHQRAKNDALFRKVYGSFAPNHDDSGAIVPEETRNEIWWNKISERFAQTSIAIDPALLDDDVEEVIDLEKEEAEIKDAVESFDPVELGLDKLEEEAKEAKEVEEMLEEISSLLETLSSYQRIRNSSLATSSRTTVGQNNPLTDLMGSPSTPSTAEMEVYKTLKLQLALLINSLPPYAVARLNGDQLEELNIKTSIVIESDNPRGVMTEDEASRALKQQAYAAAAPPGPALNRTGSSGAYAGYTATPSQYAAHGRTPVAPATVRPAAPAAYYPQSQSRPAQVPYQRSASGVQTYSAGYPSTTPRASYPQQGYPQATPRPSSFQSNNSSSHYLQQLHNITGQKTNYTAPQQQYSQSTPATQRQTYTHPSTPASGYQGVRGGGGYAPSPAPMYNYPAAGSPQVRTASPLTTSASIPPPQYGQPRPAYGTPASGASQQNSSYYRPPVPPASQGGQGYNPQAQAYLQQQQQQRLTAPGVGTPSRQTSGTPPVPVQNGNGGGYTGAPGQVNGTPVAMGVHQAS